MIQRNCLPQPSRFKSKSFSIEIGTVMKSKRNFVNISMTNNSINRFTQPSCNFRFFTQSFKTINSLIGFFFVVVLIHRSVIGRFLFWLIAVRTGDKQIVALLFKKKANVNCQLDNTHHALLTPLNIACGSLEPTIADIVRILLAYGAEVNAESLSLVYPLVLSILNMVIRSFLSLYVCV